MTKKRKSRFSRFTVFLMTYAGILIAVVVILLFLLHGLLKDYESSMPANTMDKVLTQFTPENMPALLDEYSEVTSEFENEDTIKEYFDDILTDNNLTYKRKAGEYSNTTPVYEVVAGNRNIAKVTLGEAGKNRHKFTAWEVDTITFDTSATETAALTISAPSNAQVTINGKTVGDSYITEKNVTFDPVKNVSAYVKTPTNTVYTIDGMISEPEVKASVNGTQLTVKAEKNKYTVSYPLDDSFIQAENAKITSINQAYGKYIINRGTLAELNKYLVGNAKSYVSDIPAVWAFLYGKTYTYEFKNQNICNAVKYSNDCYSCEVNYDLYVNWGDGDKTYNTSMIYTFVKTNGEWYLADFTIN